jgi:hypothetical protein
MTTIDFHAPAELFLGSDWATAAAQGPRRFRTAAQALRFAFEEAAPVSLHGAALRLGDQTIGREDLPGLYRSGAFPLPRKPVTKGKRRSRQ